MENRCGSPLPPEPLRQGAAALEAETAPLAGKVGVFQAKNGGNPQPACTLQVPFDRPMSVPGSKTTGHDAGRISQPLSAGRLLQGQLRQLTIVSSVYRNVLHPQDAATPSSEIQCRPAITSITAIPHGTTRLLGFIDRSGFRFECCRAIRAAPRARRRIGQQLLERLLVRT